MERFAHQAASALNKILKSPIQAQDLEIPPDVNLGEFAFPCFKLAKEFRKAPAQVASQLAQDLLPHLPKEVTAVPTGPYVNFRVPPSEYMGALLKDILEGSDRGSYGQLAPQSRGTWVLEFSSPNVAKPFQIYHLRPTALGAALDRIGRFRGFKVVSINHLGDWGTQYGKLAVALQLYGSELPAEPSVLDLVGLYVRYHQASESDPTLDHRAREAFARLEKNDPEMLALWNRCVQISMREFLILYKRLGVEFDHIWGESYYKDMLAPLLKTLRDQGLLELSEGAQVVRVNDAEGKELPPCILEKSDGATIYATRDVAAAIYRYEQFKFDRMTYIVGGEQRLHFQQVFAVLKKMGHEWAARCEHVPTGLYRFKDAKMSTRKGNFVTLDDVLTLAKERVTTLLKEREPSSGSPLDPESTSETVALGAVTFHDLHTDPARDVEFDIERVVDFEGETGPYLQYAHTRCLSIIRKAKETGEWPKSPQLFESSWVSKLVKTEEHLLVKTLGQFPLHLERSLNFSKASQLAHYLIEVTRVFGAFYRECHVLGQGPELTGARLMLVEATRRILGQGLYLLGVPLPDRM